jgi:hypothetical protein
MRLIKVSVAGLVLAGILAVAPTAAFARGGGGGGGHGGGGGFGGGHGGGGGHAGGFAGHGFAAHGWHGGHYWGGGPWGWYGDNYWDDYPYYGYDDYNDGDYEQTVVAVQQELEKLGYYHGQIDGIVGPETRKAISWFQSVDKLSVSGRIDDATLKALQIS